MTFSASSLLGILFANSYVTSLEQRDSRGEWACVCEEGSLAEAALSHLKEDVHIWDKEVINTPDLPT